jgi:hypothetical protein
MHTNIHSVEGALRKGVHSPAHMHRATKVSPVHVGGRVGRAFQAAPPREEGLSVQCVGT